MDELEKIRADLMGAQIALGTAVRALMRSHPNPAALLAAMELENQDSLAHLTNMPIADLVLEAYHLTWKLAGPKDPEAGPGA